MKRKTICVFIIGMIFYSFSIAPIVNAETLEEQKNQTKEKREEAEQQLEYVENELSSALVKIQTLDDTIRHAEQEIANMDAQITSLTLTLDRTTRNLDEVQTKYNKNKKIMEKRLVVMYECGDISYLDLLLHSSSLVDFLSNYYTIEQIMQSDNEILRNIEEEKEQIEAQKQELEKDKTQLKLLKVKQEQTRIIMENNKTVQQNAIDKLSDNEKALEQQIKAYKDEEARIESAIILASQYEYVGEYTGGIMLWPIAKSGTYITSGYGTREHPIQGVIKMHTGIDIGNAGFGAPVVAAADGVVTLASYYGGYGNCVMINHGNGVSTLYGHGQKILTTVGTEVKKGDLIMEFGSTGNSTGPHLHFEVRINGSPVSPLTYLGVSTTTSNSKDNTNKNITISN